MDSRAASGDRPHRGTHWERKRTGGAAATGLAAASATRAVGREPQSASASTDANVPLSRRIPAIAIGAGGTGGAAHTANEWYDDTDGDLGLERAIRLVVALGTAERLAR